MDLKNLLQADYSHEEMGIKIFKGYDSMLPEEWTARYSHTDGCGSFDQFQYSNKTFEK